MEALEGVVDGLAKSCRGQDGAEAFGMSGMTWGWAGVWPPSTANLCSIKKHYFSSRRKRKNKTSRAENQDALFAQ